MLDKSNENSELGDGFGLIWFVVWFGAKWATQGHKTGEMSIFRDGLGGNLGKAKKCCAQLNYEGEHGIHSMLW